MFGALSGIVHVDGKGIAASANICCPPATPSPSRCSSPAATMPPRAMAGCWRWSGAAAENRSDLAVFNATDVEAGPVALVQLGHRVPDGFHGNWVGAA